VEVSVLEKHADELGLHDQFAALPRSRLEGWGLELPDGRPARGIDFTRLRSPHRCIAMVPRWDLLDSLAGPDGKSRRSPYA
jgi:hypothetical protein